MAWNWYRWHAVDVFSRDGVIFPLFPVGLDTSLDGMQQVGRHSMLVAVSGMLLPFALGLLAIRTLMPELAMYTDLFIAATLGATSAGITARVLQDLGRQHSTEARLILGAAVIDDILGLLLLAIVSGIVVTGGVEIAEILLVIFLATVFLVGASLIGPCFLRLVVRYCATWIPWKPRCSLPTFLSWSRHGWQIWRDWPRSSAHSPPAWYCRRPI